MSGGGSKPRGGKMGTSIRAASVSAEAVQNEEKEPSTLVDKWNVVGKIIADVIDSLKSEHSYLKKQLASLEAASQLKKDELEKIISVIQKDLVDPEKLQATLADGNLSEDCDLKKALEMVTLLQAQLKEMNPNLDSITEYRGKVALYNERVEELNAVTQNRDDVKRQHDELKKKRQGIP
ncbi:unnamed protein product [Linum tenue]|uniref:Uncharacterized protein n=1 Tax=Linum tenue TaxID=586396 RepID=A0AAV0N451_9ROSI|nr:unnamed protein product [Linum tenue]